MKVSIIIVNYNTYQLTVNCIHSVIDQTKNTEYEIILVDNASTECEPDKFLTVFPGIQLVRSKTNGGFAHGNNQGLEKARGELVLLLNSDTLLVEDSISKSVSFIEQHNDIGVLGCKMTFANGKYQTSVRPFKTIGWELLDIFQFIPYLMPYKKRSSLMQGKYFRNDHDLECDWIGGAFFMVPRSVINQLQGQKLDERFFMYGEDQLWCEQIRKLGYKIFFYAGTSIIHIHSGSTDHSKQIAMRRTMMKHELEIMKMRKGKGLYYFFYKMIYVTKESFRNFIKWIAYKITGKMVIK